MFLSGVHVVVYVFQVTDHICMLQDYVNGMSCLHVDEHEYGYLKLLILFSPGNNKHIFANTVFGFVSANNIEDLQLTMVSDGVKTSKTYSLTQIKI